MQGHERSLGVLSTLPSERSWGAGASTWVRVGGPEGLGDQPAGTGWSGWVPRPAGEVGGHGAQWSVLGREETAEEGSLAWAGPRRVRGLVAAPRGGRGGPAERYSRGVQARRASLHGGLCMTPGQKMGVLPGSSASGLG